MPLPREKNREGLERGSGREGSEEEKSGNRNISKEEGDRILNEEGNGVVRVGKEGNSGLLMGSSREIPGKREEGEVTK